MNNARIERIKALLTAQLSPITLEVVDDSHHHIGHAGAKNGAGHFTLKICSDVFCDKSLVARHKMIYNALDEMMHKEIHALSIEAITLIEKDKR